jgi:hypothetical protein
VRATSIYTYARMRATCVRGADIRVHVDYMLYVIQCVATCMCNRSRRAGMCACARMHASIHAFTQARRACISLSLSLDHACVHALTYMFLYVCIYIYIYICHLEMAFAMHARVPGRGYERPRSVNIT